MKLTNFRKYIFK